MNHAATRLHADPALASAQAPAAHAAGLAGERQAHAARLAAALQGRVEPVPAGRLATLGARFGLSPLEADVLAALWVCAYEPGLRLELLRHDPLAAQVGVRPVAPLFGHEPRVRLSSESPLLLWRMVQEHALLDGSAALSPDPSVLAWLDGEQEPDRALAGRLQVLVPGRALPSWPLDEAARRLHEGLRLGQRWRVHLRTADVLAARWFAAGVCARLGLTAVAVQTAGMGPEELTAAAVSLHRQAFLDDAVPCLAGADVALSRPPSVVPYPLLFLHGECVFDPASGVQDAEWTLEPPTPAEREQLWRQACPEAASWPASELADLSLFQDAGVSDIAAVAALKPDGPAEAAQALRSSRRGEPAPFVRHIDATFGWDDLVLPAEATQRLQDITFEARERRRVWAEPEAARLFPYGRGLVALFAGPPGTGKTMAAQVIAADLGLDLLAVDIAAVVSKWVGETAQHLQQLLASNAARRSVLFFDEADALYAKRVDDVRDAQDRYANLDSSHLMTALEAYPGIVLLATNLKANIDNAFVRRIRHVVDFPKPDAPARERLWRRVVPALFGTSHGAALAPMLPRIARVEATGAVIKNAALSALFAARRAGRDPDLALLGEMLARELAKEGAGLSARELARCLETPA